MTTWSEARGPGSSWQILRSFEHVPFSGRTDEVFGTRTVDDLVGGLDELLVSEKGRIVGDRRFRRYKHVSDDEYLEVLWCTDLGQPGEVLEHPFSDKLVPGTVYPSRWAVALLFDRYAPGSDRRVAMSNDVKDHDRWGSPVFSSYGVDAGVGIKHVFRDLKVAEHVAAEELTALIEYAPYMEHEAPIKRGRDLDLAAQAALDALSQGS